MKVRVPLIGAATYRDSDTTEDVDIINMYGEEDGTGRKMLRARPGYQLYKDFTNGTPQGLTWFNDAVHAVINDTLYHDTQAVNLIANATAWTQLVAAPKWGIAGGGAAIVFKGRLWYFGGRMAAGTVYRNIAYSSLDGVNWIEASVACPWAGRSYFGLVEFAGKLWAFGGVNFSGILKDVWCSEDGLHWTLVTTSAQFGQRYAFGYVAVNDGIYVIGGVGTDLDNWLSDVWFTNDGVVWNQVKTDDNDANLGRRAWSPCLYYDNKLWMLFGQKRSGPPAGGVTTTLDAVAFSSDGGATWSAYTTLTGATRYAGGACVYNGKMWYMGGNSGGYTDDIFSSTTGSSWTTVSTGPGWAARQNMGLVVWQTPASMNSKRAQSIWLIGGEGAAGIYYNIWAADLNASSATSHALTVLTSFERMRFDTINNGQLLVFKNLHKLWVYDGYSVIEITSPNVPKKMCDGVAVLNDTVYVMDVQGTIYNSRLTDPFTWNSLDFIQAEFADDEGIFIAKHLNYIVAMKSRSIQFFQDAGNPLGSPLAPMLNYTMQVGCAAASSVVRLDNMIIFMSTGGSFGRQIQVLEGLQLRVISNPAIDRCLETNSPSSACAFKHGGHLFYLINTSSRTLVCDISTGLWYKWATGSTSGSDFPALEFINSGTKNLFLDKGSSGTVYFALEGLTDDGTAYQVMARTQPHDFGNRTRKFLSRLELVCDKTGAATTTTIDWSDDDYLSYSPAGTVSEASEQPALWRCGSFRRRAFRVKRLVSNYPPRWEAIDLDIGTEQGKG